jgi:hypothetical protein
VLLYEGVVGQVRIGLTDAINLLTLAGGQVLFWIEAPSAFEKALPPQDFMDAWDAAAELMGWVEDRGIRVRDLLG